MKIKLLLLSFIALCLVSCGSKEKRTVKAKGKYSLELPGAFEKAKGLNKDASLQYQDIYNDLYVIVIDETKGELKRVLVKNEMTQVYPNDLNGYSDIIINGIGPEITIDSLPPFKEELINDLKSRQIAFEGTSEGLHIFWKFAFVEGQNTYYQIMAWTSSDKREKFEPMMDEIIHSFKETDRSGKQ